MKDIKKKSKDKIIDIRDDERAFERVQEYEKALNDSYEEFIKDLTDEDEEFIDES